MFANFSKNYYKYYDIMQQSNRWLWEMAEGTMAFGEACWAAIEGSGGAEPRRKMSDEGVGVDVVRREGRLMCWDK